MAEAPVVDASPLIHLSRAGFLPLLQALGSRLLLPAAVLRELEAKGPEDVTVRAVREIPWLTPMPPIDVPSEIARYQLGAGESAALAWAISRPGTLVVTDDARARKTARVLGIPRIGTLGVVVRARQTDLIPAARPVIETLMARGMYISKPLVQEALELIGE